MACLTRKIESEDLIILRGSKGCGKSLNLVKSHPPSEKCFIYYCFRDCKKYCGLAVWEIQLTNKEVVCYHKTWPSQHNLMILKDNILRMNFPTLIPILLAVLNKTFPSIADFEMVCKKEQSVNGFMYEAEFFAYAIKGLDFVYKKHNGTIGIDLSLDVVHVEDCSRHLEVAIQ